MKEKFICMKVRFMETILTMLFWIDSVKYCFIMNIIVSQIMKMLLKTSCTTLRKKWGRKGRGMNSG
ncbi:hypothetical protein C2L98_15335 [Enterococcus gallinarum]|nr:hypothetical protein C2L98_15335 [Enterococcus gallinarum]